MLAAVCGSGQTPVSMHCVPVERMYASGYVPPAGKRKNRAARPSRASSGRRFVAEVVPEAIVSSRSLSFHCEMSAPLSASSHATHSSCAASTPVNASVASPGPYTVPLKPLTDTVAAGSVALAATAANPKTNDILFITLPGPIQDLPTALPTDLPSLQLPGTR